MKKLLYIFFTILSFTHLYSNNINWSYPPLEISGSFNATNPLVAIDTNGDAIAIWIENNYVKSSSKPASGSWTSEVVVSAAGASSPALVMDSNGNTTAAWVGNGSVYAATKTLTGNWSSSSALSNTGASSPTLCVDAAGDVVAAWARNGNIESSTKLFGMSWQNRVTITSTAATVPIIAVGGTGTNARAVIVWQGTSAGSPAIFSSTKLVSTTTWTSAQMISETTHNAAQPYVAMDSNANAIAIWYAYDITGNSYTNVTVKASERFSSNGVWNAVQALSLPGIRNPATLTAEVAFDSIGNAIALWNTSFDDMTFNIESAVKPVNGTWSAPTDLVTSNLYAYSSDLSATPFGDVLGLYMFFNGEALLIQSVESDINGFMNNSWSVPITVSYDDHNGFPQLAASLNGNVIHAAAIWTYYNGVNNTVVASTGSKTLVLPPSGLTVTQSSNNYGVFNAYYNTLSWDASPDPTVVGYLVFRNGLFVEQVGSSVLQFVDENRAQNGSVTYSVTAINPQQVQSTNVSINFP